MKKSFFYILFAAVVGELFMLAGTVTAADHVVVIPLGGTVGNATAADVAKGKTFSSRSAGKGATGTLVQHPMGQSFTNSNGMTFNLLPAGTFTMGSPDGSGSEPEEPGRLDRETQHQVTLTRSFYMQITEVTNKQWNTLIFDTGLGAKPSHSHTGNNYPVEYVNWFEAAYFANQLSLNENFSLCYTLNNCDATKPGAGMTCASVDISDTCTGYRLPTEAEWEYAARAGTTTAYANPINFDSTDTETQDGFNSNLHAMGWYKYNNAMENSSTVTAYEAGTKPVGAKQANFWGLYDMHGNVAEWCRDWGSSDYLPAPVTDPIGDTTGSFRVMRGGGYADSARNARSAFRIVWNIPDDSYSTLGFRLVLPSGQ